MNAVLYPSLKSLGSIPVKLSSRQLDVLSYNYERFKTRAKGLLSGGGATVKSPAVGWDYNKISCHGAGLQ